VRRSARSRGTEGAADTRNKTRPAVRGSAADFTLTCAGRELALAGVRAATRRTRTTHSRPCALARCCSHQRRTPAPLPCWEARRPQRSHRQPPTAASAGLACAIAASGTAVTCPAKAASGVMAGTEASGDAGATDASGDASATGMISTTPILVTMTHDCASWPATSDTVSVLVRQSTPRTSDTWN